MREDRHRDASSHQAIYLSISTWRVICLNLRSDVKEFK